MHNDFSQTEQTYITSTHSDQVTLPASYCPLVLSGHFLPLCKGNHSPDLYTDQVHAFLLYTNIITEYPFVSAFFCSTVCVKDPAT